MKKIFLKIITKLEKINFSIKAVVLIVSFIVVGNILASFFGLTRELTSVVYPADKIGLIAGVNTGCSTSCPTIDSYYEKWLMSNYDRSTTFEQRKAAFLKDNGDYFVLQNKDIYQVLWPYLENNDPRKEQALTNYLAIFDNATNAGIAYSMRAWKHSNMTQTGKDAIKARYVTWLSQSDHSTGIAPGSNKNGLIQQAAGNYLFFQEYASEFDPTGSKRQYLLDNIIFNYYDDYVSESFRSNEFDMGNYTWTYVGAAALLYDLANDQTVKQRSKMALDFLMLDIGMDFSANQPGGGAGSRVYTSYLVSKEGIMDQKCILLGLGCAFPEEYAPSYDIYLTSYRVPDAILDAVDIGDEADNYYHEHFEYNNDIDPRGKVTYVTKYYNLGGGYEWRWLFNAKSDTFDGCREKNIGFPFRLVTLPFQPYDDLAGYSSSGRHPTAFMGGAHYQYKNYLVARENSQQYLHAFTKLLCGAISNFNERLASWDVHEYDQNGGTERYFLKEGKTMVAIEINGGQVVMEVALEGIDYANLSAFKTAFTGRGANQTSKGVSVLKNSGGDVFVNGSAYYPSGNFPRLETRDNNGNYIVKWIIGQKKMTVSKHGKVCNYNFNNWSYTGDCGGGSLATGSGSAPGSGTVVDTGGTTGSNTSGGTTGGTTGSNTSGGTTGGTTGSGSTSGTTNNQTMPTNLTLRFDFSGDNKIDVRDFGILLSYWGQTNAKHNIGPVDGATCQNTDSANLVDELDLVTLLTCWGTPTNSCCYEETSSGSGSIISQVSVPATCTPQMAPTLSQPGADKIPFSFHGDYPELVTDSSNNVHMIYVSDISSDCRKGIFYSKYNGTSWSTPVNIDSFNLVGVEGLGRYAPQMEIDSTNNLHVVWRGTAGIYYSSSVDGISWSSPVLLPTSDNSMSISMTIDSSNNIWVSFRRKWKVGTVEYDDVPVLEKENGTNSFKLISTLMSGSGNGAPHCFTGLGVLQNTVSEILCCDNVYQTTCANNSCQSTSGINIGSLRCDDREPELGVSGGEIYTALGLHERPSMKLYQKMSYGWQEVGNLNWSAGTYNFEQLPNEVVANSVNLFVASTLGLKEAPNTNGAKTKDVFYYDTASPARFAVYKLSTGTLGSDSPIFPASNPDHTGDGALTVVGNKIMAVWYDGKDGYLHYKLID